MTKILWHVPIPFHSANDVYKSIVLPHRIMCPFYAKNAQRKMPKPMSKTALKLTK